MTVKNIIRTIFSMRHIFLFFNAFIGIFALLIILWTTGINRQSIITAARNRR
jgi:hypothetical protein